MSKFKEYLEGYITSNRKKTDPLPWNSLDEIKALDSFKDMLRMGFRLISTDRMHNHGTLLFQHPRSSRAKEQDSFQITPNGYVRRLSKRNTWQGEGIVDMYPINKKTPWYRKQLTSVQDIDTAIKFLVHWLSSKEHYSFTPKKLPQERELKVTLIPTKIGMYINVETSDGGFDSFSSLAEFTSYIKKLMKP
jgi:hypothetical protein